MASEKTQHGRSCRIAGALLLPVLCVSACATRNAPRIEAHYYGECVRPLVRMQEADSRLSQSAAQGALAGALAGAVIGMMVTASNPYALPVGLGVGLAAGAAVGAGVGYSFAKIEQIADEDTRFASIRVTANQDLTKANRLQLYSYECMQCYMREFDALKTSYEQGRILKAEYNARFQEIYNAMKILGGIIGSMDKELTRTEGEFKHSLASTAVQIPSPKPQPALETKTKPRRKRSARDFSSSLSTNCSRVRQAQDKNDADLTAILSESAGRVSPPKQQPERIKQEYGESYANARQEINDLRSVHKEALTIMHEAALEAGIDMV
ncbi:MAG: hypothetical protein IJU76_05230 [Desulfovibrionaceae bacterium]|nr:hypothetical protein [Desulfovibrionaceae bacterium]